MGFAVQVVTPPAVAPYDVDAMMTWLRLDEESERPIVEELIDQARVLIERTYDLALISQTLNFIVDRFPIPSSPYLWQQYSWGYWWQRLPMMQLTGSWWPERAALFIPRSPLQSVVSISYVDQAGRTQTLPASNYNVDTARKPGRVVPAYGLFWPFTLPSINSVTVQYQAGYGQAPNQIPATLRGAIRIAVHQWYEERVEPDKLPDGAINLLMSEYSGEYY